MAAKLYSLIRSQIKNTISSQNLRAVTDSNYDAHSSSLGKFVCIDTLSRHIFAHVNLDTASFQTSHHNEDEIRNLRNHLLRDIIWTEVGKDKPFATGLELPFHCLYDRFRRKFLGLPADHADHWVKVFYLRKNKEWNTFSLPHIDDLVEARRVKFETFEAIALYLKRLDRLTRLRQYFETTVEELQSPTCSITRFVCLDIEAHENSPRKLTEFGMAIYDRSNQSLEAHHIIVKEHAKLSNRKFTPGAKHKFAFGDSLRMSTGDAVSFLGKLLGQPHTALLGHSLDNDIRFIRRAKVGFSGKKINIPVLDTIPKYDLQYLYRCRSATDQCSKLEDICKALDIPTRAIVMHNAGNDAALTLAAFLRLIGLDTQVDHR